EVEDVANDPSFHGRQLAIRMRIVKYPKAVSTLVGSLGDHGTKIAGVTEPACGATWAVDSIPWFDRLTTNGINPVSVDLPRKADKRTDRGVLEPAQALKR
ncbi:MAG: hypothetical protein ACREPE_08090, partial [Lysobacter sp.]